MSLISLSIDGLTARLSIDNPRRRNALSRAMWRAIPPLVEQACSTAGVRALILESAAAGCFAAGADISEFEATHANAEESARASGEVHAAVGALTRCEFPTLALIDGPCVGGGVALALACDIRLASERALFAITPAKLGLSYDPDDVARLVRVCGPAIAAELLFAGLPWTAERAVIAGLANRLFPTHEFASGCRTLIEAICGNSPASTKALKLGIAAATSADPPGEARRLANDRFLALFGGADFTEGRRAFLEKRPPRF